MMEKANIKKAVENIDFLNSDININEIISHIKTGSLSELISAWRSASNEQLNNIREALKNDGK